VFQGFPRHRKRVSKLLCKTGKFYLCQFQWYFCIWDLRIHLTRYVV